jgi:hypothetical protein
MDMNSPCDQGIEAGAKTVRPRERSVWLTPSFSIPIATNPKHNKSSTSLANSRTQSGALGAADFAANPIFYLTPAPVGKSLAPVGGTMLSNVFKSHGFVTIAIIYYRHNFRHPNHISILCNCLYLSCVRRVPLLINVPVGIEMWLCYGYAK